MKKESQGLLEKKAILPDISRAPSEHPRPQSFDQFLRNLCNHYTEREVLTVQLQRQRKEMDKDISFSHLSKQLIEKENAEKLACLLELLEKKHGCTEVDVYAEDEEDGVEAQENTSLPQFPIGVLGKPEVLAPQVSSFTERKENTYCPQPPVVEGSTKQPWQLP